MHIVLSREKSGDDKISPIRKFLMMIPFMKKAATLSKIEKELEAAQKEFMEKFDNKSMSEEDLQYILTTMSDTQLDNLLLEL